MITGGGLKAGPAPPPPNPICSGREEVSAGAARLLPQVVPATEDEVGFCVEGGAHLPQAAVAAGAFQAVLVPVFVQGLEQVAVFNLAIAASAPLLFPFGLDGEHRHTCSDKETSSHV